MVHILNSSLVRLGSLKYVLSAERLEEINGENTLDFSAVLDGRTASLITDTSVFETEGQYFDTAYIKKSANEDNTFSIDIEAEHVSYRLNDPAYNMEYFAGTGLPSSILGEILDGTGFTVGAVEYTVSVTYSAQEAKSRRQLLMEFVAYLGGEVQFNNFVVDIVSHRGSDEIISVIKNRNIRIVERTLNKRQKDKAGDFLVSYSCIPIYLPGDSYTLGDNVLLRQLELGLDEELRVVRISKNPFNEMETQLVFANYINDLASSLFRIETSSVIKGKTYYGARISPENGFESIRTDLMARTVMNADTFQMQSGDGTGNWIPRIYFDPELRLYIFDGTLSADTIEALKAEIDIVISNTIIVNNLTAEKAYIADLTVDRLETSVKVYNYLNSITTDVYYIRILNNVIEFMEAQCDPVHEPVPVTNRALDPLYWIDDTHYGVTNEPTEAQLLLPVLVYYYDEFIKRQETFVDDPDSEFLIPQSTWGVGTGTGNRGKAIWQKRQDGMYFTYTARGSGTLAEDTELVIAMTDDGMTLTGFSGGGGGESNLYIADDFPVDAPDGTALLDTNDYAHRSHGSSAVACTIDPRVNDLFEFTGTSAFTAEISSIGMTAGCELSLLNSSTAIITLTVTINGISQNKIFPHDAMTLEWTGTQWMLISSTGGTRFARVNADGGYMIKVINKTGANSVKGHVVTPASGTDMGVSKIVTNIPNPIGVFYESGVPDGSYAWVVVSGLAEVYFIGSTTRGHLARGFITGDTGYVTGQALSEAIPTPPFNTDKHFYEIGHVISARTGAGLAWVVLHFN